MRTYDQRVASRTPVSSELDQSSDFEVGHRCHREVSSSPPRKLSPKSSGPPAPSGLPPCRLRAVVAPPPGSQIGPFPGRAQLQAPGPAGDLVGVIRLIVVDRLAANRISAFRRLPEARTRRVRASDVGSLTEECDRRKGDMSAIRCASRACRSNLGTSPSTGLTWPDRACLYVSLSRGKERVREGT